MPATAWKSLLANWPSGVSRGGVVVTSFGEQIIFESYLLAEDLVLFDRRTPDTIGARKVFVPYENIVALKIVDVVKSKLFEPLGFTGESSNR